MKRIASTLFVCLIAAAAFAQTEGQHAHGAMMSPGPMNHDRMFADAMSKHHQDGILMAQLAVDKAENPELRTMAQTMIDDQRREIDKMQSLRGEGPATPMSDMHHVPGMMQESEMKGDMARLESAKGRAFDAAFTEIMSKHHQGAIKMANHYLEHGTSAELKEIAEQIADKQTREREQLLAMHRDLTGEPPAMTSSSSGERRRMSKN